MTGHTDPEPLEDRPRDIESLIQTDSHRLDDLDFLAGLLDRVKDILQVDMATVLLLDYASGTLVATAAAGLEEEVRQGVRIPVGRGFAGRIAAERKPVILDRVDHTTVVNPVLLAKGVKSLMGVPLLAGGQVSGVIYAGTLAPRQFTGDDVRLLQLAADQAASAVQSINSRADQIAAAALQRSLLPSRLPEVAGAEIAARYIPGSGAVGGDWYDVFALPTGELGIVIGDVAGSGLPAAVIMGRIRSALRAYALITRDPAEVLDLLDAKMQHFEPNPLATMLYAVINPALDTMRLSLAGHFPPVIARPPQPAELADVPPGLMIGVAPGERRQTGTVKLTPGTLLCFYTDGLIERPGEPIDDSLARLRQAVTAEPPEDACAAVMAALVGDQPARDDIALLIFRRQPQLTTSPN